MPRRLRMRLPGVTVHVIQRGNNRAPCFFEDSDRDCYLFHLVRAAAEAGCSVHAYCLMTNHVHLLATPAAEDSLPVMMQRVGQNYAQYVNRTHGRCGTLWEGRYKSCLVQSERYVLDCYRYIELNPVRAGIASSARDHAWSSFRINSGEAQSPDLVPHPEYLALGSTREERAQAYARLFGTLHEAAFVDEIRRATNGGFLLGDRGFSKSIAVRLGRRVEPGRAGRPARRNEQAEAQPDLLGGG